MPMSPMPSWKSTHDVLSERCAKLGLPVWAYDACGNVASEPAQPVALARWLSSPVLRTLIERAARSLTAATHRSPAGHSMMALFPGAWLIGVEYRSGARIDGTSLALVLQKDALHSDEFEAITASANMSMDEIRRLIKPVLRRSHADVTQLHEVLGWTIDDISTIANEKHTLNQFGEKLVQAYEETNMLFRLARSLNCVHEPLELMTIVCHQLQQTLPLRWVAARFSATAQRNAIVPGLADQMILAGDLPCNQSEFDQQICQLLRNWQAQDWTRLLEPDKHPIAAMVNAEVIAEQITHDSEVIGVLLGGNRLGDEVELCSSEMQFIDAAADFMGVFHENLARFAEQRTLFLGTLKALTAAIDAKDPYTCGHSERVALLARKVATALELDAATIEQYHIAGLVHDVGKIGVPEAVLCKPGRLSDAEFEIVKRHPNTGCDILKGIPMLEPMLPGVMHHHERWNGSGYPSGLKNEHIPLMARVLAMADAFDAMSSNRSYRPAMSRQQVLAEIRRCSGSQFDPEIAKVFLTLDFCDFDAMLSRYAGQSRQAA